MVYNEGMKHKNTANEEGRPHQPYSAKSVGCHVTSGQLTPLLTNTMLQTRKKPVKRKGVSKPKKQGQTEVQKEKNEHISSNGDKFFC